MADNVPSLHSTTGPEPGDPAETAYEQRRSRGLRIAGIGFLLIVLNGLVDLLWWNVLWQVLTAVGLALIGAGMWMAREM